MFSKEKINRKTMLKRNKITIARLREILIVLIENKKIITNNALNFYRFVHFDSFLKNEFNNVLNIFDVDCNFDKKKAKNLKKKK